MRPITGLVVEVNWGEFTWLRSSLGSQRAAVHTRLMYCLPRTAMPPACPGRITLAVYKGTPAHRDAPGLSGGESRSPSTKGHPRTAMPPACPGENHARRLQRDTRAPRCPRPVRGRITLAVYKGTPAHRDAPGLSGGESLWYLEVSSGSIASLRSEREPPPASRGHRGPRALLCRQRA